MSRDGRILPARRVAKDRHVGGFPDAARLPAGRAVAQADPRRLAARLDPDGAAVAAGGRPITLRHLLTHTAGFVYDIWNPEMTRYLETTGTPDTADGPPSLEDYGDWSSWPRRTRRTVRHL